MSNEGFENMAAPVTEGALSNEGQAAINVQPAEGLSQGIQSIQGAENNGAEQNEAGATANAGGEGTSGLPEEPKDLNDAMRMLNDIQSARDEEADKSSKQGDIQSTNEPPTDNQSEGQTSDNAKVQGSTESANQNNAGPTDSTPQFNQQQYIKDVNNAIEMQARQNAIGVLQKAGVKLMEFKDLIHQEETPNGVETSFRNPDTGEPFADRVAAQAWLNTQNEQVKNELIKIKNEQVQHIRNDVGPAVQTAIFRNTIYPTLDDTTKTVLNQLIDKDMYQTANGQWACRANLNVALAQAQSIVSSLYNGKPGTQQAMKNEANAAPITQPAVNMKTGGNPKGSNNIPEEPKDLNEAMRIINNSK